MYKNKIILVLLILIFGYAIKPGSCSEPGRRPDQTPWFGSVSDKIVKLYDDLYELRSKQSEEIKDLKLKMNKKIAKLNKKKSNAKSLGLPFINDSKSDYDDLIAETREEYSNKIAEKQKEHNIKIREIKNEIVDTMASPSDDSIKKKKEALGEVQHISEMYETISAIINAKEVVRSLNSDLRLNRNDYELASKTYAIQLELLNMTTHINDIFIDRLDSYYKKNLLIRIENNKRALKRNIEDMKESNVPKAFVERQNDKINKIDAATKKVVHQLETLKENALINRKKLEREYSKAKIIKRASDSAKEVKNYVAQINEDLVSLQIDIPDIEEFEFRESDLEITASHAAFK